MNQCFQEMGPSIRIVALFVALGFSACVWPGCAASPEREGAVAATPARRAVPVALRDLSEWWTNGSMLLHLRRDGGYELHESINRYEPPIERGRWSQRNYLALDFDPYGRFAGDSERVQIDRDSEGGLVLIMRRMLPFVPLRSPPDVLEDALVGEWRGPDFSLALGEDLRYRLRQTSEAEADGAGPERGSVSGHQGSWRLLDHERLILEPDASQIQPLTLRLIYTDEGVSIEDATRGTDR